MAYNNRRRPTKEAGMMETFIQGTVEFYKELLELFVYDVCEE